MSDATQAGTIACNGAVSVSPSNPMRKRIFISITNISSDSSTVYVLPSDNQTVASGAGIPLLVNQNVTDSTQSGYECWQGNYQVFGTTASSSVVVVERGEG
jgi:hypothetical protein